MAKGFKQVEGLDYFETFAPTCKPETFRILLQLSAKQGHVMHQFDVKTAFLHSPIEEEVYLEQPQEFVKRGSDGEKLVCRLNKSIYGLKQAANNWYKELANFLLRQGFTRRRNDHCLFARSEAEDHTFILVWVDDIIVASRSMTVVSDVKKALEATFHMEDRGRLHWFLGLRIRREEGNVTVDQERYIETMLERFQMDQWKPSRTPADLNLKPQTAQNGDEEVDQRIYRSLVGSLLYLAKQTRPDIMFTVNILSRHMNAPTNQHWMCGKRLLRYLQGSKGLKLTYTKEASYDLVGESDADWSGDVNDRKSTTGCYFKLNGRGAALSWGVKKQATVALFFIRSRISGHGSSSSGSTLPETTSRRFWHPTETSNSNWRGQPKLYQTLPKPSHAQEEQAHRDKVPLHSRQNGGLDYFNSLRSYRQNGSGHLHKVLTRFQSGNIQSSFDGNRLYAISSSLSGGVRISIKL